MRNLLLLFFALPLFVGAQTSYRIDRVSDSSFYLVEVVKTAPTPEKPVAETKEFPQRFNTKAQLVAYVDYLKKQAADSRAQAKKLLDIAPRLEQAATQIEALLPEVSPPPVVKTPATKPKTKTKKS